MRNEYQTKLFVEEFEKVCKELFSYFHSDLLSKIDLKSGQNYFNPEEEQQRMALIDSSFANNKLTYEDTPLFFSNYVKTEISKQVKTKNQIDFSLPMIYEDKICFIVFFFSTTQYKKYSNQIIFKNVFDVLKRYVKIQWDTNLHFIYSGEIVQTLFKSAIDDIFKNIASDCCKYGGVTLYGQLNSQLYNIVSELSFVRYEKSKSKGLIYFVDSDYTNLINYRFAFDSPIDFSKDKIRLIRKILELSDSKVGIITDTNKMYGIGSIPKECSFNYYKVEFQDDFKWNLYQKNTLNPILEIQNNDLVQKKSLYSKDIFINSALQVFPNEKGKGTIEKIEEAISELVKQEHGTIVVIKRDANQLVHKYADLSLIIKPTPLTKDNIKRLSSIDGAIIMNEKGICYGFGTILDGIDTKNGNPERGSRYNSSQRFFEMNSQNNDLLVLVLSDDGMCEIFKR